MISGIDPPDFVDEAEHLQMLQTKQSMANNVLWQRKEQLDRWQTSDMNKLPPSRRPVHNFKVKFGEKDVLFAACMSGDEDEVEQLQQKGIDINTCGMDGVTVLHQAVIDDKYDTVKFLVEHGADINVQDNEGWTPLHAAVCCANLDIIQYLCTMGADLTVVNSDMELAIDLAKEDECKEYLEGEYAKNNITFEECRNREHQVIQRDCAEWTTRGVFGDVPHQRTGATALHVAASKNYLDLLVPLLKSGADVHAGDVDGWTPLHAAAHWGHLQMCRLLLENGASLEDTNYAGDNVIRVADKAIIEDLEKLQLLFKDVERPGQVLQNNNSLSSRKTSRSEEKLQIHIHEDFGQNENTSISSASHECSPPPAKKKETDDRRIISSQDPVEPPAMNSSFTTSARVELVKPSDDVTIESDLIRLPSQSVSMDDEDEDLSKETSVSSVESKVSSASSCDQSDRNLVSSSDDLSKSHSASEISQTSSPSDFTTRLPLLESSSENAVPQRPTKLSDSVRRNYDFSSNDSRSQDVSISSAERSSNTTSRESSVGSKESSNSSHVEFTVRMKGNRAGWLQDGKRADAKKTVGAIPSIRPASSTSSNASSANSSSPLQSPMQRKTSWQTPPMQPSQKDEREAERKAKSRMQRATRRSTQAITTEDLNSARSWKSSALTLEGVDDGDQEFDKKEQSSLESNGSVTQSSSNSSVNADAPVPNAGSTLSPIVPSPAHTPSAAHLRRRSHVNRANRRGTGPVSMDDIQAASCSLQGRDEETGNGVVLPNIRLDMNGSTDSERVKDEINYKILYEGEQRTNDKLLKQIEQLEKKLLESERVSALSLTRSTFANSATLDEKDKRFYERKIEELENRTKDYEQMRNDNKRLKEENGALIRVISKLSK